MSEVFRERVIESPVEPQEAPQAPRELKSDKLAGNEDKAQDEPTNEEKKLDIWEGLWRKKYVNEYFDTHNTSDDFLVKMPTSEIDKYIRQEIERLGYEKTTENYKKILQEIEAEIGSDRLELFKRFTKITGYIRAVSKLQKAKELRDKYFNSTD